VAVPERDRLGIEGLAGVEQWCGYRGGAGNLRRRLIVLEDVGDGGLRGEIGVDEFAGPGAGDVAGHRPGVEDRLQAVQVQAVAVGEGGPTGRRRGARG
jgi:hypothetical protein